MTKIQIQGFLDKNHRFIGFLFGLTVHPTVQALLGLVRP